MHRARTTALHFLLTGFLVIAVGCGGGGAADSADSGDADDAASPSFDDVDVCALMTRAQIGEMLGAEVGDGEEFGLFGCQWSTASGTDVRLQVFREYGEGKVCEAQKILVSGREEEVPGLGESALWGSSGNLVVCTRQAVVRSDIDDSRNAPTEDRVVLERIARATLDRLGI